MLGAVVSAALLLAASLVVGQALLALGGRRDPSLLAGPVGLGALLVVAGAVAGWGGRGVAIAIALGALLAASAAVVLIKVSRPVFDPAAVAAAGFAALAAAIPFIASGHFGILGVGLVNDDMASHLLLADWIDARFRPEPVLVDQGYPLGPHALVAGLGSALHTSSIEGFAGLTMAIPALTALVACSALDTLGSAVRALVSALVALPYLAAAYLAQEAFKEPIIALFVLAFALLLPTVRSWREAIPLGLLAASTTYVYSFPGLAWLVGTGLVYWAITTIERWWRGDRARGLRSMDARTVRSRDAKRPRRGVPPAPALAAAAGVATLIILVLPELTRLADFVDFRALHPDRANDGGLGNLPGQLSPLEALGIWPTSEFRLSATASSVPALAFYAGGVVALVGLALALPRWLKRYGTALPAALAAAAALYLAARVLGTVYTSAKALAIAAPLITLITLGGLLADGSPQRGSEAEDDRGRFPTGDERAMRKNSEGAREAAAGEGRRRLRSMDARKSRSMDAKRLRPGLPRRLPALLALVFAIPAAASSFLILRQAPVAPTDHMDELAQIRPLVAGQKVLFLGRDNFVLYELRGSKPFTHVRNFYDPYFVEPNFRLANVGSKFDFDSVTARTLAKFPYVVTTRAAYASGPPPGYERDTTTQSYVLWHKTRSPLGREPAETGAEPGRTGGCPAGTAPGRLSTFAEAPVLAPASDWSTTTVHSGGSATVELELPPGSWELSLQYDATRSLTLAESASSQSLPGNLDYRGTAPFWPAGRIEVAAGESTTVEATVERPPLAGRLLGARSVAHLGSIAATAVGPGDPRPGCDGYVDWYLP